MQEEGCAVVPIDQNSGGGYGRIIQMPNGASAVDFVVLTKAEKERLEVITSRYSIRVFKHGTRNLSKMQEGGDAASESGDESMLVASADANCNVENDPHVQQTTLKEGGVAKARKRSPKMWGCSTSKALKNKSTQVVHLRGAGLKVTVPFED
jgi:hypothetical protein